MIRAFRYNRDALIACDHGGPRIRVDGVELGGNLVGLPVDPWIVVLYLPLAQCAIDIAEHHRAALLAALGLCNACAQLLDEHNDEDRADCAAILHEIALDEAAQ